ncbi:MAG: glycosyltransferase family 4 protein [Sulfuricellaceae bacterium]|nr:glycosyltransferase family 4 protein [Sulfuricellaceae bacterium]
MLFFLLKSGLASVAMDHPNTRSLHSSPIPRTGGLAIMAGIAAAWIAARGNGLDLMWLLACLLALLSFADDKYGLPVLGRMAAHIAAAGVFAWAYCPPDTAPWVGAAVILGMVWAINLYNFMDGADGLAGGMALFGFGFLGVAAWQADHAALAWAGFSVAATALAFLAFNFHPARLFMGDSGSVPLGFLAAAMGLSGWQQGAWPLWFPVLVFSPFGVDASVTLLKRMAAKKRFWQGHKEHYYQRLIALSGSQKRIVSGAYVLMAGAGISGLLGRAHGDWAVILLLGWGVFYFSMMVIVDKRWADYLRGKHVD